jgi:uncharacterized protein YfdQ (DUF2303 family)
MIDSEIIEAIARLARAGVEPKDHPAGGKFVMRPDGLVHHIPTLDPVLSHVKQNVTAFDVESFAAYVNRFKLGGGKDEKEWTTIFSDPNKYKIRAVIDYHVDRAPERCAHTIHFDVPFSEQWKRWTNIDGRPLGQSEFAEFIEENALDIVDPPSATFLDLVTNLQSKKKVTFESGIRLQDGANQLVYAEEIETKGRGTMVVPSEFHIGVPIFHNAEGYKVRALLRYRISEGAVVFIVKLHRKLFLEQTAFEDVTGEIVEKTGLNVLSAWT